MVRSSANVNVRFRYVAARADGRTVRGRLAAPDESSAAAALLDEGLSPMRLSLESASRWRAKQIKAAELAPACRCMATLFSVGASADRMLLAAIEVSDGRARSVLERARAGVREGKPLSAALTSTDVELPALVADMIRAGEEGGRLGDTLVEVAAHLEFEADSRARLRSALTYPFVVGIVGAASLAVIVAVVIPRFAELFADVTQEVPPATRVVLTVSLVVSEQWPTLVALAGLLIVGFELWRRTTGRAQINWLLGRLPLVGSIREAFSTARVCRSIGSLLRTGVSLPRAIGATAHAAGDAVTAERLFRARERIERGDSIASSFHAERVVLPVANQLIAVGEQGGTLDSMFTKAADLASDQGARRLQALLTVLEPLMIVLFGGLIALVAMTLLSAIYSFRPGI